MSAHRLPEGMELDLNFYMTDDQGITVKVSIKGLPAFPADKLDAADVEGLAKALGIDLPLSPDGRWRAMTRAEIRALKQDEEAA